MKLIQDIYSVAQQLFSIINNSALQVEIQNLNKYRVSVRQPQQAQPPQNIIQEAILNIDRIIDILSKIPTELWTSDHEYVSQKLGFDTLIGEKGKKHLESYKIQLQINPTTYPTVLQNVINELNNFKMKVTQFISILQPFEIESNIKIINENEGLIELTFDGDVAINDFKEAKEQMNDWFLIIEGYARLANARREDFEIISITKNSPAKFKIKTTITNTALILGIISSLLTVEKTILENRLMIDKLKRSTLVADEKLQKQFIEMSEKHIEEKVNAEINRIVEEKMAEFKSNETGTGDIKTNLSKSIHNQYNFIVNGGNVNIQVINGAVKQEVDKLEKTKDELKQIKEAYENQKILTTGNNNENSDSLNIQKN